MLAKLKRPFLSIAAAIFIAHPCHAQTSGAKLMRGCAIAVAALDGTPTTEIVDLRDSSTCIGMVEGVEGTLVTLELRGKQRHTSLADTACLPDGYSTAQGIRITYKYMQDHPDQLNGAASGLIYLALTRAFPCKAE